MSSQAQPVDPENVESIADYLLAMYAEVRQFDRGIHAGLQRLRERLVALQVAEDPDIMADVRLIESDPALLLKAEPFESYAARTRARAPLDA